MFSKNYMIGLMSKLDRLFLGSPKPAETCPIAYTSALQA